VPANPYRGYRFPEEIISQCVWLYFNFAISLREVELMMAYRGVQLSYETIRRRCDTFGASYAAKLKRKRHKLGDKWFLDEVFLRNCHVGKLCEGICRIHQSHPRC
jgi:putative transposase